MARRYAAMVGLMVRRRRSGGYGGDCINYIASAAGGELRSSQGSTGL